MISSDTRIRTTAEFGKSTTKETLMVAGDRLTRGSLASPLIAVSEEVLIVDDRSGLSPAQAVENRLSHLLSGTTVPISHLLVRGRVRSR